ncbi:MAG: EF-hand domain-containing protein [Candidatus Eremiobacteraeota bacterium]|nr:EF-hand domain-containing protein [Candidatus Eremiobacteraeota bacterium]MCW5866763.1 EF-hand domain-containing protein [Candidatus Eremiobacteraeota bacterium]
MKHYLYLLAALLLGCTQAPNVSSSETPSVEVSSSATPGQGRRGERFRKMMEEMDTDHDGKLSDAEKEAGFDKRLKESERFRERVDEDGDGKISPEERKAGLENFMKRRGRRPHREDASPVPSDSETPE